MLWCMKHSRNQTHIESAHRHTDMHRASHTARAQSIDIIHIHNIPKHAMEKFGQTDLSDCHSSLKLPSNWQPFTQPFIIYKVLEYSIYFVDFIHLASLPYPNNLRLLFHCNRSLWIGSSPCSSNANSTLSPRKIGFPSIYPLTTRLSCEERTFAPNFFWISACLPLEGLSCEYLTHILYATTLQYKASCVEDWFKRATVL